MATQSGRLVFKVLILAILLIGGGAAIWIARHPGDASQMLGLRAGSVQKEVASDAQAAPAGDNESAGPARRSPDVVHFNATPTTAQMSPELRRQLGTPGDARVNDASASALATPGEAKGEAREDEDKALGKDEAAKAIKKDAKAIGAKDALEDGVDPAAPAPVPARETNSADELGPDAARPEPEKTKKAELRVAIAKAIASSDSAQRIMRIEDHVAALRADMRYMKDAMATLLERTAPAANEKAVKKPENVPTQAVSQAPDDDSDDADPKKAVADKKGKSTESETANKESPEVLSDVPKQKAPAEPAGKPSITKGPLSIESISYEATGDDAAVVTLRLAGNAYPRTRLLTGAQKEWAGQKDWAALDVYGASIDTKLPINKGIIRRAKSGKHGKFVRLLFVTTKHRLLTAHVEANPGVVTLALQRGGKTTPRKKSHGQPKEDRAKATHSEKSRWTIRAISAGAAVLYDATNRKLMSVREASRVPSMGVVTRIQPARGIVETTRGRISVGG